MRCRVKRINSNGTGNPRKNNLRFPKSLAVSFVPFIVIKAKWSLTIHHKPTNQTNEGMGRLTPGWLRVDQPQSDFNCSLGLYFQTRHASRWPNHTGTRWTVRSSRRRRPLQPHITPLIPDAAPESWWSTRANPKSRTWTLPTLTIPRSSWSNATQCLTCLSYHNPLFSDLPVLRCLPAPDSLPWRSWFKTRFIVVPLIA